MPDRVDNAPTGTRSTAAASDDHPRPTSTRRAQVRPLIALPSPTGSAGGVVRGDHRRVRPGQWQATATGPAASGNRTPDLLITRSRTTATTASTSDNNCRSHIFGFTSGTVRPGFAPRLIPRSANPLHRARAATTWVKARNRPPPAPGGLASPEHDVILSGIQVRVAHGFAADVGAPYRRAGGSPG